MPPKVPLKFVDIGLLALDVGNFDSHLCCAVHMSLIGDLQASYHSSEPQWLILHVDQVECLSRSGYIQNNLHEND